ncbi:MAG: hypothetical protein Q9227_000305 [Pyrenula ochraceoflavens]
MESRQEMLNSNSAAINGSHTEINGAHQDLVKEGSPASPLKRKLEQLEPNPQMTDKRDERQKGSAPIKREYLVPHDATDAKSQMDAPDDDAAEAFHHIDRSTESSNSKKRQKSQGQNKNRKFGSSRDEVGLCLSRINAPELSPGTCRFGDSCKFEHDLRVYLKKHKREDLKTFGGVCPVWETHGRCPDGWKCRFVGSHSKEIEHEDGRKELLLATRGNGVNENLQDHGEDKEGTGSRNALPPCQRMEIMKRRFKTPKADIYIRHFDEEIAEEQRRSKAKKKPRHDRANTSSGEDAEADAIQDNRAQYREPPLLPSEKRKLYFGPETPVLAPLTTQGNLPFRRLCTDLGAQFTYSEMAMSVPLLNGQRSEWALMKAHESELLPPTFTSASQDTIVQQYAYNQSSDLRFGAQIAGNKPWNVLKATEMLTTLLPSGLRVVDLNCGCPIDLVFREGAGSGLLDHPSRLERMLLGMNAVSNEVPISVKIRMGTRDNRPTAQKLIERLLHGNTSASQKEDPCGVAAITLHGRSRQQRYTRSADWGYIAECSALIKRLQSQEAALTDTIHEPDPRSKPSAQGGKTFFLGNGDCYSHIDYQTHLAHSGVDTVMVGRGALMKPWLFEEISTNQYLDKSASERLGYVEKFVRYGLEAWGSDEIGVGTTRRFLLEWLSFACRYVPIGLLEVLPPNLQDRPPSYRGRNELETLLASDNYLDWIKISEMFLGPAHKDFKFQPKHKSNAYETEG